MKTTMTKQFLFLAILGCVAAPVTAQTVDVTLQCGQSYTINSTVPATAATGLSYRWLENGSPVTGTAANYTVPATKSVGVYTYIRQAKTTGCADWQNSNAFTVEVKNKEGIDGVCLGGLMWAKYNVDEPGTFAATPDAPGKLYQFNRKTALPASGGTYTFSITSIDEDSDWLTDNDPCPTGWHLPSYTEFVNLRNAIMFYSATPFPNTNNSGACYTSRVNPEPCTLSAEKSIFVPFVHTRFSPNAVLYLNSEANLWDATQTSTTTASSAFVRSTKAFDLGTHTKTSAASVRCVKN
jgi:uncharacterized protein (TIGR02145 family)